MEIISWRGKVTVKTLLTQNHRMTLIGVFEEDLSTTGEDKGRYNTTEGNHNRRTCDEFQGRPFGKGGPRKIRRGQKSTRSLGNFPGMGENYCHIKAGEK